MAFGQQILFTIENGKYKEQFYMHHIEEDNTIILISDTHILSINKYNTQIEEWNVSIRDISGLGMDKQGIIIQLNAYLSSSVFESPTPFRIIYTKPQNRERLFGIILDWLKVLKATYSR